VREKAAMHSPAAQAGRYFFFCASVPKSRIPLKPMLWCALRRGGAGKGDEEEKEAEEAEG
jgi:hypothetical protein